MTRLRKQYLEKVVPSLKKQFSYANVHQVPRLKSIVVAIGTGPAASDTKLADLMQDTLRRITGQQPAVRKARKAISAFKVRENQSVGLQVTLRGQRMEDFFDKLVNITLPRVRDFRGVNSKSFDGHGNYSLGLKEQNVFPEIPFEEVEKQHGIQITITTSAKNDTEARALLTQLGMPFAKGDVEKEAEMTKGEDRASLLAHAKAKAAATKTAGATE
jgi:large subunit ribosomal protein L5